MIVFFSKNRPTGDVEEGAQCDRGCAGGGVILFRNMGNSRTVTSLGRKATRRAMLRKLCRPAAICRRLALTSPCRGFATGIVVPGTPRTLTDVAKLDLLQSEDPARIGAIWEAFHQEQQSVAGCAIDPVDDSTIVERGGESPNFVFPMRREGGHFMLFSQFSPAHRMFVLTSLEDYRRAPEMAQPWASVHMFDELVATKGVGLLRAEVLPERLTSAEAAHLLLLYQRFYGTSNYDKVWKFNHAERHFDLDGYLATCP